MKSRRGGDRIDRIAIKHVAYCQVHGKALYATRRAAKRTIRQLNDSHLREYRCDQSAERLWHVGHMPDAVKKGRTTVREIYQDGKGAA
jgi:hypothetical protein